MKTETKPTPTGGRFFGTLFFSLIVIALSVASAARAAVDLKTWTSAPWNATSGVTSFAGSVTDPSYNGGTAATFTFDTPLTGVDVTTPANPVFTSATASFFGFEATGFGVGDSGLGRFTRGESFAFHCSHAFRLNQITWAEFTGDEVLQIAWTAGGVVQNTVFNVTTNPSVFPSIVADAGTSVVITNVSASTANLSGRLRVNTVNVSLADPAALAGPPVDLKTWTSSPWNATSGVTAFSGAVTDGDGTAGTFTFDTPLTGVGITDPANPVFTSATNSFFGFEATGFGVGDTGLGRFTRGESFAFHCSHTFQLNQITWAEFTGDEVLNISWTANGAAHDTVFNVTANPSLFPDIVADANTSVVVTNVSASTANLSGRLRVNTVNVSFVTSVQSVPGSTLVMNNWTSYPFNGVAGNATMTGTIVSPENGGTTATMTFANPLKGVNITDPANPVFTGATASYFGFEATGFGVGETNVGRFERGESFTLACAHRFSIDEIFWAEFTGDESVNIQWTQDGTAHNQVFAIDNAKYLLSGVVADGNTPVVFTNVSPSTANLSGRLRFTTILASLVFDSVPTYDVGGSDGYTRMFGVNLAGGEGGTVPGTYGTNYIYPNDNEFAYYHGKNQNIIRVPFRWERVQHTLNAALDTTELSRLDSVIGYAASRGMKVLLDMHNYDRYNGNLVGSASVPYSAFTDVWQKLADHFKTSTAIYAYGLMNEPHDTGGTWPTAAQAGVNGVRASDTTHWITLCGDSWASASSWPTSNPNLASVTDSSGKIIYEAHCYFANSNNDQYGTYDAEGAYPDKGIVKVSPFVYWLKQHNARGLVGEYGVPGNDSRWLPVLDHFLAYLYANGVSGTDWAGGPWWGSYPLSVEPTSNFTVDKPQMSVLQTYE